MGVFKIRKTQEQYVKEVENLNNDIKVIGAYVNNSTKILHECANGHQWEVTPKNILRGHGCPYCYGNVKKTHDEFLNDVINTFGNIYEFLGQYTGLHNKIKIKHKECGNVWDAPPLQFYLKRKTTDIYCPFCNNRIVFTTEDFKQSVCELVGSEYIVLGEYVNNSTPIKMLHNVPNCMNEYSAIPTDFKNSHGCPICKESKGEKRIRDWLKVNNFIFDLQMKFDGLMGLGGGNLSYDFYLPQQNLLIEYQGEFHDGTGKGYTKVNLKKQQEHDKRKRKYANDNSIRLLEIWYWDFNNIEKILEKELY